MKSLFKNLLLLTSVFSLVFLFSCGDDDVENPVDGPTLSVTASSSTYTPDDTIAFDVTYDVPGAFGGFNYSWTATDGETVVSFDKQFHSPSELDGVVQSDLSGAFTFKPFGDKKIDLLDLTLDGEAYILAGKDLEFKFEIFNASQDGQGDSTTVSVSVEEGIVTNMETLLGGPSNATTGSFYDVLEDSVYTAGNAFDPESQPNIDLLFWYGNESLYAIGATDDADAETAFESQAQITLSNLETRNATRFKLLADGSATTFDEVSTQSELLDITDEGVGITETSVKQLEVDDVFVFVLATDRGEKLGAAKVISIAGTDGSTRAITILAKVQK